MFNIRYKWIKLEEAESYKLRVLEMSKPTYLMVEEHRICVVRLAEGYFGMNNVCPHAGAALHNGYCNKHGVVACPVHGYKFDVKNGRSIDGNNYHTKTFKIDKREDGFYVGIKKF